MRVGSADLGFNRQAIVQHNDAFLIGVIDDLGVEVTVYADLVGDFQDHLS